MIGLPRQPGSWHWDHEKRFSREPQLVGLFRPVDFDPVLATADPGGESIRHSPPAPWFATVWFPMRNGPTSWLITTRVDKAHYRGRRPGSCSSKDFKVLQLSMRLEIRPEMELTRHRICRLNISRRFDASRGSDKNFVRGFTHTHTHTHMHALLRGESVQELTLLIKTYTSLHTRIRMQRQTDGRTDTQSDGGR